MIKRYSRQIMERIWEEENKFKIWLQIECHSSDAMAKFGYIPKKAALNIRKKSKFSLKRINDLEKNIKHDVLAFLTNLSENIGEDARFLHQGMTSSDIVDTALSIRMKDASEIIIQDIKNLLKVLKSQSMKYKLTPIMGRSHGIHAETTTFGLKLAGFYSEFKRNLERMEKAKNEISTCAISGPVGNYASIDPRVEKYVAKKLNLKIETISTQCIPRDRHAHFFSTLGIIASSIERLSTEIRNLQRTEIREVEEFFSLKQKGSSAMPHKRNPILSENLTGISRYIRGQVIPALENVSLWHERDISHSSVERIIAPDTTIALDFALSRLEKIIKNLKVYPKNMIKNINLLSGVSSSQIILLELTQKGVSRERAYEIVQKASRETFTTKNNFKDSLLKFEECKKNLGKNIIEKIIKNKDYKKNINLVYKRVFNK